jgi:hypothetical protein
MRFPLMHTKWYPHFRLCDKGVICISYFLHVLYIHATCISQLLIWSFNASFKLMIISSAKQINSCVTCNRYSLFVAVVQ